MSTKFKAMKFWIGEDAALSEKVQKLLFDLGYGWAAYRNKKVQETGATCFYTTMEGSIYFNSSICGRDDFNLQRQWGEEIDIDWMRTPKEETVELNGKKYLKSALANQVGEQVVSALEEALKHIKPMD